MLGWNTHRSSRLGELLKVIHHGTKEKKKKKDTKQSVTHNY